MIQTFTQKRLLSPIVLFIFIFSLQSITAFGQAAPELLYYKFNETGTTVTNYATNPPSGTATATIMGGLSQGGSGQCGGALVGSGVSSTTDYVNTGWAPNLGNSSWTISFWTSGISANTTLYYIFGDVNSNGFRCFTNGVAGSNNWILRGGGLTDIYINGGATATPHLCAFVYDNTLNIVKGYLDGVVVSTVAQSALNITGNGPFKVMGYSSNIGAPSGGKLDEFRFYNRALSAAEVLSLNNLSTTSTISVTANGSYTSPSGNHIWTTSATYMDTVSNAAGCDSIITINLTVNGGQVIVSDTFNYTGNYQTFTVPPNVTSIKIQAYGAQGGTPTVGGTGGLGAYATGVHSVTPGQVFGVFVGGQDGFNGGGMGGQNGNTIFAGQPGTLGASGGGASDIRPITDTSLNGRILVAGGGGGGGYNGVWPSCQTAGPAGNGGDAGLVGTDGTYGVGNICNCGGGGGDAGKGATQTAGGLHGNYHGSTSCLRTSWTAGTDGSLGQGGNGSLTYHNGTGAAGGGGGGLFGGGAGGNGSDTTPGGGGGGGSSTTTTLTADTITGGVRSGNGLIVITYLSNTQTGPTFSKGKIQSKSFCMGVSSVSLDSLLSVNYTTTGKTLTWSIATSPSHGSLNGFTTTATSNGSTILPTGLSYTATNGFSGNDTFSVVVIDSAYADTTSIIFTINPLPTVYAGNDTAICDGNSYILNGTGANTYSWDQNVIDGISFIPTITHTYTVTGTDINGCINVDSILVTVHQLPIVNAGADTAVCNGQTAILQGTGANTYTWNNGVTNAVAFTPAATQTYIVTGTDNHNCVNIDSVVVTINQTTASTTNLTVCDSITWNGTTYTTSGTHTFTTTGANGCDSVATLILTVNTTPFIASTTPNTACAGASTYLAATANSGSSVVWYDGNAVNSNVLGTGDTLHLTAPTNTTIYYAGLATTSDTFHSHLAFENSNNGAMQDINVLNNLNASGIIFYPTGTGLVHYRMYYRNGTVINNDTDSTGWSFIGEADINTNVPLTPVTLNFNTPVAMSSGQVYGLYISATTSGKFVSYANTFVPVNNGDISITNTGYGKGLPMFNAFHNSPRSFNFSLLYSTAVTNACTNNYRTPITLTVNPLPSVNAGTDTAICSENQITLTGSGNATSFTWDNNISNGVPFQPLASQTYTVTGTDIHGCSSTDQVVVTVRSLPNVQTGDDSTICSGTPVTYVPSGALSYNWSASTNQSTYTLIPGATATLTQSPTTTTAYKLTGTDVNGCQNFDTVLVTVRPLPTSTIDGTGSMSCFDANGNLFTLKGNSTAGNPAWSVISNPNSLNITWNTAQNVDSPIVKILGGTGGNVAFKYTVTSNQVPNCGISEKIITLRVIPIPTVNTIGNLSICNETPIAAATFTSPQDSASNPVTYTWSNIAPPTGLNGQNVSGNLPGYTAINTADILIYDAIKVKPTITLNNNSLVCAGNETLVRTVEVKPTPRMNLVNPQDTIICNGLPLQLKFATHVTNHFSWTSTGNAIGLQVNTGVDSIPTFTAKNTNGKFDVVRNFTVQIDTVNGCPGSPLNFPVIVKQTPTLVNILKDSICSGELYHFAPNAIDSNTVVAWKRVGPNGVNDTSIGTGTINETLNSNYNLSYTTALYNLHLSVHGCTADTNLTITVKPVPETPTFTLPTDFCHNTAYINLQANRAPYANENFIWSTEPDSALFQSQQRAMIKFALGQNIIHLKSELNGTGCKTATYTDTFNNTPTPFADPYIIKKEYLVNDILNHIVLVCLHNPVQNYHWGRTRASDLREDNTIYAAEKGQELYFKNPADFDVNNYYYWVKIVTDTENNCFRQIYYNGPFVSKTEDVIVNNNTPTIMKVYPNPAQTNVAVELTGNVEGTYEIKIQDVIGQVIQTFEMTDKKQQVDVQALPSGYYLISCWHQGVHIATTKLIKN